MCGSLCFSWVDPVFCTTYVDIGYELVFDFRDVIAGKTFIPRDYGVAQVIFV